MFANPLVLADHVPANQNLTVAKSTANGSVRTNLGAAASASETLSFRHTIDEGKPNQKNRSNAHFSFTEYDAVTGAPYVTTGDISISRHKKAALSTTQKICAEMKSLLGVSGFADTFTRGGS